MQKNGAYPPQYFFHAPISLAQKEKILNYIGIFPIGYWKRHINISSTKLDGMLKISDGTHHHEIYLHECKEDE